MHPLIFPTYHSLVICILKSFGSKYGFQIKFRAVKGSDDAIRKKYTFYLRIFFGNLVFLYLSPLSPFSLSSYRRRCPRSGVVVLRLPSANPYQLEIFQKCNFQDWLSSLEGQSSAAQPVYKRQSRWRPATGLQHVALPQPYVHVYPCLCSSRLWDFLSSNNCLCITKSTT